MEQVCKVLRYHHYACRTEQTCCQWIMCFAHFFGVRDVERFLPDLAVEREASTSTQRQPLNAIVFLYREMPGNPLDRGIAQSGPAINKEPRPRGEDGVRAAMVLNMVPQFIAGRLTIFFLDFIFR